MEYVGKVKIGVFGGAFDPPHISHIEMARQLICERGYDKLVLLPSRRPPHKQLSVSSEDRYNMLKLLADDNMEVSRIELDYDGVGYTCDYLPLLKAEYGDDIEYIIGGDSIINFHKWSRPLEILKQVRVLVVARNGEKDACLKAMARYENNEKLGLELADYTPPAMSSTDARDRLRLGLSVDDLLDSAVIDYIRQHNLYNEYKGIIDRLKATISAERYEHSISTTLYALEHYQRLGLDHDKVLIACLLHDCAKYKLDINALREYSQENCPDLWREDAQNTPVAHAFNGAIVAMRDYGIMDEDVLSAIYYHTTAKPDMTKLEQLVYVSDVLESSRDYDGVEELRAIYEQDAYRGFLACLENGYSHINDCGNKIYPLTTDAYKYYFEEK